MQTYSIVKGDCLWNIAKSTYGDQLKSNSDIQKAVNKIAEANRIKNPDLIYAGDTLELPEYTSIFASASKEEASTKASNEISTEQYDNFSKWQKDQVDALKAGENKFVDFDFVETDISCEDDAFVEPYKEALNTMAQSNIQASDKDNDSAINYKEFVAQEVNSYNNIYDDYQFELDEETGMVKDEYNAGFNDLFKNTFTALDNDKSGNLEQNEVMALYATLDGYNAQNGSLDGKITFGTMIKVDYTEDWFGKLYKGAIDFLSK